MKSVFILSAARTAIGKYGGSLRDFTAPNLGVIVAKAALERAGYGSSLAFTGEIRVCLEHGRGDDQSRD